ncbi:hypothetical protein BC628DRAFT_1328502 [Trametes gibbosa]|nr:hypothetical protein BC628DRAFT_1328502 [Trametes gibbosa]
MVASRNFFAALSAFLVSATLVAADGANVLEARSADPCAAIAGKKWVAPKDVRACFSHFPVDPAIKANTIEVVNKTLAFHTSVNYQKQAPAPFSTDVHEDLLADLARISHQWYANELDLHIDLSRTLKRLNDGHCVYINQCFDSLFVTYLPTPLVYLTDASGHQSVHIAPEAFNVASAEFNDEIQFWQDALPFPLKGKLSSLSGAKVLAINGLDPLFAVDQNAKITGSFQSLGTRQNTFFSSYNAAATGWTYSMGNFAQQSLPLNDYATLTIQRVNNSRIETVTLPYRSRISSAAESWTDSKSFHQNNCVAIPGTNGEDVYASGSGAQRRELPENPANKFRQAPIPDASVARKHHLNVILDSAPQLDVVLPPGLTPQSPLEGSSGVAQFHMLEDGKTGVLALGSFSASSFDGLSASLLTGLQNLKSQGATQLVVDVSNNGGGFICAAHWLHRIIVGPKATTEPQAGLDTETRDGPLAQLIVKNIIAGADPDVQLLYNPVNWRNASNIGFSAGTDWLQPPVKKVINGRQDAFSQRLGDECQPFDSDPPAEGLFDPKKVAIVSNGRCASSCSLFSITMAKEEGSKTVVYGGRKGVQQQYCGTVGGQSTDFSTMDTEIKTAHLKNNTLAPPDFITNSIQGITWRLGFGLDDPQQPEEWQNHPADVNLPLTADIVNNPAAIWKQVAKTVLA